MTEDMCKGQMARETGIQDVVLGNTFRTEQYMSEDEKISYSEGVEDQITDEVLIALQDKGCDAFKGIGSQYFFGSAYKSNQHRFISWERITDKDDRTKYIDGFVDGYLGNSKQGTGLGINGFGDGILLNLLEYKIENWLEKRVGEKAVLFLTHWNNWSAFLDGVKVGRGIKKDEKKYDIKAYQIGLELGTHYKETNDSKPPV